MKDNLFRHLPGWWDEDDPHNRTIVNVISEELNNKAGQLSAFKQNIYSTTAPGVQEVGRIWKNASPLAGIKIMKIRDMTIGNHELKIFRDTEGIKIQLDAGDPVDIDRDGIFAIQGSHVEIDKRIQIEKQFEFEYEGTQFKIQDQFVSSDNILYVDIVRKKLDLPAEGSPEQFAQSKTYPLDIDKLESPDYLDNVLEFFGQKRKYNEDTEIYRKRGINNIKAGTLTRTALKHYPGSEIDKDIHVRIEQLTEKLENHFFIGGSFLGEDYLHQRLERSNTVIIYIEPEYYRNSETLGLIQYYIEQNIAAGVRAIYREESKIAWT